MLANKVLKGIKKKKEVKNDLLSKYGSPIIQSCSTIFSFEDLLALDDIHFSFLKKHLSNECKLPLIVKEVQRNNIALYKGLD
jgi:hypothetical protein